MVQASRRTGSSDSALVRLLARLAELDVRESPQGFADRLGQWLRWTDAMPLFTAADPRNGDSRNDRKSRVSTSSERIDLPS